MMYSFLYTHTTEKTFPPLNRYECQSFPRKLRKSALCISLTKSLTLTVDKSITGINIYILTHWPLIQYPLLTDVRLRCFLQHTTKLEKRNKTH